MGWANYWVFVNVFPRHTKPLPHSYQLPSSTPKDLRFFQSFAWSLRQQAFFLGAEGYKLQVSTKMRASFMKTRDLNVFTMSIVTAPWVWFLVCVIFGEGFMFQISFSSKTISKMNNMNTPIPSSVSQLSSDSCSFNNLPDWDSLPQQIFPSPTCWMNLPDLPGWVFSLRIAVRVSFRSSKPLAPWMVTKNSVFRPVPLVGEQPTRVGGEW